jgi:hypothetical protein
MSFDSGKDYLIGIHLDLSPYNKMEHTEALKAIKRHCGIPIDYVSKYDVLEKQNSNLYSDDSDDFIVPV